MGNQTVVVTILLIIAASLVLVAGSPRGLKGGQDLIVVNNPTPDTKQSLQIKKVDLISVAPSPVIPTGGAPICSGSTIGSGQVARKSEQNACCWFHVYTDDCSVCCAGVCVDANAPQRIAINPNNPPPPGIPFWCDAKPIIYLYPTKKTLVNVTITVPGRIAESIPYYPAEGWKNVEAHPDGILYYKDKKYSELFYEAAVTPINPPTKGLIVKSSDLKSTLNDVTTKLGLIEREQEEFLQYWVPKLQSLGSPYIFVSVFDEQTKQAIDKVQINPKPDTFIEFIFYFKPVSVQAFVESLELPNTPPQRNGFTAVEWGGIIDSE